MRLKIFAVMALVMLVTVPNPTFGQSLHLWNDLKAGPYSAGFKVLWKRDYSRTWQNEE